MRQSASKIIELNLIFINPFLANAPILYPLEKKQKTKGFSGVFRVCKMGTLANGLKKFTNFL